MKKIRGERRLSLNEISKNTRIQAKYLEYLEEGEYNKLPADVYVRGFLKSYAEFLGVNEKSLVKIYEREKGIQKNIKNSESEEKAMEPLKLTKWVITPRIIIGTAVALLIFSAFFYIYKEVDTFISEPRLVITNPQEGQKIEGKSVTIKGVTDKDSVLSINGQSVIIGENGEFSTDVSLQKGNNTINVISRNKFEKESMRSVSVIAEFEEAEAENNAPVTNEEISANNVWVEITVKSESTWLEVMADGNIVFSGTLPPDAPQRFEARTKISVTSGRGNQTYIKSNGKDLGVLSNNPGIVRDIVIDSNTTSLNN